MKPSFNLSLITAALIVSFGGAANAASQTYVVPPNTIKLTVTIKGGGGGGAGGDKDGIGGSGANGALLQIEFPVSPSDVVTYESGVAGGGGGSWTRPAKKDGGTAGIGAPSGGKGADSGTTRDPTANGSGGGGGGGGASSISVNGVVIARAGGGGGGGGGSWERAGNPGVAAPVATVAANCDAAKTGLAGVQVDPDGGGTGGGGGGFNDGTTAGNAGPLSGLDKGRAADGGFSGASCSTVTILRQDVAGGGAGGAGAPQSNGVATAEAGKDGANGDVAFQPTIDPPVPPVINDASVATPMNTSKGGDAGAGGQVPPGSVYSVPPTTAHGTVTIDPSTGAYTYTPNTGYFGPDSFVVTVCLPAPNEAMCDTAEISVTVSAVATPPNINNASLTTPENTSTGGNAGDGGQVPPGATYEVPGQPTNGQVNIDPITGAYTYIPNTGYTGTDSFEVKVCLAAPDNLLCDTATISVTVTPVIAPPVINDASLTTPENTSTGGNAGDGGQVPPGATYEVPGQPTNGQVNIDPNTGAYTYIPNTGYTGTDSFEVKVCLAAPNDKLCDTATISVTVHPASVVPPVINDSSLTTTVDTSKGGTTSGQVPPGSSFTVPTNPGNGQVTIDPNTGAYTYTPNPGYEGPDSFEVKVCLAAPNDKVCDTATVSVTVSKPGAVTATPVPTLSQWALALLGMLTAGVGMVATRRKDRR